MSLFHIQLSDPHIMKCLCMCVCVFVSLCEGGRVGEAEVEEESRGGGGGRRKHEAREEGEKN